MLSHAAARIAVDVKMFCWIIRTRNAFVAFFPSASVSVYTMFVHIQEIVGCINNIIICE